ncbi:MAG: thrombospondin type 3 repeat-containing protein, partial [bacterium]|nr:thrombospondin type 3 repeat-containing protein [bacterium]
MPEQLGAPPAPPPQPQADSFKPQAPPTNLPTAEAEDIFAGVPESSVSGGGPAQPVPPIGEQASRGGMGKKLLIAGGAAVLLIIVVVVVWLVFFRGGEGTGADTLAPTTATPASSAPETSVPSPEPATSPESTSPSSGATTESAEPSAPAAAPATDADGDGLSDAEEVELGTNVQS